MVFEIEYKYTLGGMVALRVDELGNETVTDAWNPLTGLTKCTSHPPEDREEFAQTMALTWAVYTSREHGIHEGIEA